MTRENTVHRYDVILLPSQRQVVAFRKQAARVAARAGEGAAACEQAATADAATCEASDGVDADMPGPRTSFGVTVSTFDAWAADLWELYGDGRTVVSSTERMLFMTAAFDKAENSLPCTEGSVRLAACCVQEAAGLDEFKRACRAARDGADDAVAIGETCKVAAGTGATGEACKTDATDGGAACVESLWGEAERALLRVMACYFGLLHEAGLVEFSDALAALPATLPSHVRAVVLMDGFPPLTWQQRRFFDACSQFVLHERPATGAEGVAPLGENIDVRFAFPSGRYAKPRLLVDMALSALAGGEYPSGRVCGEKACDLSDFSSGVGLTDRDKAEPDQQAARVVVACTDPRATYEDVAGVLAREGATCALSSRVRFSDTDFGRALAALNRFAAEDGRREDLIDVLYMPFSGVPAAVVRALDARLRGDRLLDPHEECVALRLSSPAFSYLEDMAQDPEAYVLAGALEDAMRRMPGVSDAYRREQIGAVGAAREAMRIACDLGIDMAACLSVLAQTTVNASRREGSDADPIASDVLLCDWATAAALSPCSCDLLVLADAESANHPVSDREDAATALLEKLGLRRVDDALAQARREFAALERVPRHTLVIERCLHDVDAEPTYPAMVVEELIDCYRADPSATDDIDNPYALPLALQRGMVERGEDLLYENAAVTRAPQPVAARIRRPDMGSVSLERRPLVVLSRTKAGEVRLSASQLESYLACPYLWFVQRRLKTDSLDEEFGPLQMGDFAHHVLCSFYQRFQEVTGEGKVTLGSLPQARAVMEATLAETEDLQRTLEPQDNRLVALTELETRDVESLKARLMRYLDFEVQLLPDFRPTYFEHDIAQSEPVEYAGVKLAGKIDRIDVDDAGRAVIIDYKGSVSADFELRGAEGAPPHKVQTLIYAQVAKRTLGLDVVGALYVSYGRNPYLAGAYDAGALESPHLPSMRYERCRCGGEGDLSFSDLLDQTEERCAQAAQALVNGVVEPAPAGAYACAYCPHTACAYRRD